MDNFKHLTICFIFLNAAMCYYDKITTFIFQLNITPKHFYWLVPPSTTVEGQHILLPLQAYKTVFCFCFFTSDPSAQGWFVKSCKLIRKLSISHTQKQAMTYLKGQNEWAIKLWWWVHNIQTLWNHSYPGAQTWHRWQTQSHLQTKRERRARERERECVCVWCEADSAGC